jgi:hypothetical protein
LRPCSFPFKALLFPLCPRYKPSTGDLLPCLVAAAAERLPWFTDQQLQMMMMGLREQHRRRREPLDLAPLMEAAHVSSKGVNKDILAYLHAICQKILMLDS